VPRLVLLVLEGWSRVVESLLRLPALRPAGSFLSVFAILLMLSPEPCYPDADKLSGRGAPPEAIGRKILTLLREEGMTDAQKVRRLAGIRGHLTPHGAATLVSFLENCRGELFVALAMCMDRCGAGREALSVAQDVISDKSTPVSQFSAALYFAMLAGFREERMSQAVRLYKIATDALVERLRNPPSTSALLALLRERKFIWHRGTMWAARSEVVEELARLVETATGDVQREAAGVLSRTIAADLLPATTVVPLARLAANCDAETAISISNLLTKVLGAGPKTKNPDEIKKFWENWLARNGAEFSLARHALKRAQSSEKLPFEERVFLGRQIAFTVRELPEDERAKVWATLRQIFLADKSPSRERCAAWLWPLVRIASREGSKDMRRECLALLMNMLASKDETLRHWALSSLGDLPEALEPGSASRQILDKAFSDAHAPPEGRARAAWSLRKALRGNPDLAEKMIGKTLSLDPSTWRKALADYLPQGARPKGPQPPHAPESPGRRRKPADRAGQPSKPHTMTETYR